MLKQWILPLLFLSGLVLHGEIIHEQKWETPFSGKEVLLTRNRIGVIPSGERTPDGEKTIALKILSKPDDLSYESVIEVEHGLWMLREHKMCIIWAVKDWLYPEKYLHKWMNYCPDAKVHRVRNAGRFIAEDAPEELIAIISGFLGVEGQ